MTIKQFVFNPFQENTYLVYDDTGEAIIIDAGCSSAAEQNMITTFIADNKLIIKHLVNTHCHIDHVLGVNALKTKYGASFAVHSQDTPMLAHLPAQAAMFGIEPQPTPAVDRALEHADTITFGGITLTVIHTPGHSMGGICLYSEEHKALFTGDTLFRGSIGRTDLMGGNYETIINSINTRLFTLPHDVTVYPGHGDSSSIGYEKKNNPFFR